MIKNYYSYIQDEKTTIKDRRNKEGDMKELFDNTLSRAVNILKSKNIINKIILYGSYARGDYDYNSDIDIMAIYNSNINHSRILRDIRNECEELIDFKSPDIQVVFYCEDSINNQESTFMESVRRDGITLWERKTS